jgi:hypothetical protein
MGLNAFFAETAQVRGTLFGLKIVQKSAVQAFFDQSIFPPFLLELKP